MALVLLAVHLAVHLVGRWLLVHLAVFLVVHLGLLACLGLDLLIFRDRWGHCLLGLPGHCLPGHYLPGHYLPGLDDLVHLGHYLLGLNLLDLLDHCLLDHWVPAGLDQLQLSCH